jgi:predicted anti-sigma-YlaC factor YlaD
MVSLPCHQMRVLAALEPDGALSETERKRLDSHLSRCPSCRALHDRARVLAATMRDAPSESPAPCAWPNSAKRVSVARRTHGRRWNPTIITTSGIAASLVAAMLVGRAIGESPAAPVGGPVIVIDASADDSAELVRVAHAYANRRTSFGGDPPAGNRPGVRSE